jgi:BMFP domain-containing protein YqiC
MTNQPNIEELTRRLMGFLPANAEVIQEDVKKNLKAILNAAFARMDLVTREEFDVQTQLLARTRERLESMERQVALLEAELLKERPPSGP